MTATGTAWVELAGAGPRATGGGADLADPVADPMAGSVSGPVAEPAARRVLLEVGAAALVVLVVVGAAGLLVVQRIAERQAVTEAAVRTDLLARSVVMPALTDALRAGDPAARRRLDDVVRAQVLTSGFVRVKIWAPDGTVLYSDAADLVGRRFAMDDEARAVLSSPATRAEVSEPNGPENVHEQGLGRLLEVYRPVWTPSGAVLLFETYADDAPVASRTWGLGRAFGGILVSSLLVFGVLLAPLLWRLLGRLARARRQRELLLRHALEASDLERRRIAADLHDGVVQELVATSLHLAAAERSAHPPEGAATAVRSAVGRLRTLLVDIYPPNLHSAGLAAALEDLASGLRGRGLQVSVRVPDPLPVPEGIERLLYRVARETTTNVAKHAAAASVSITVDVEDDLVRLEVADDGVGLDPASLVTHGDEPPGDRPDAPGGADVHLGLRLLTDLAREHGASLAVAGAPGVGTRWRVEVPR